MEWGLAPGPADDVAVGASAVAGVLAAQVEDAHGAGRVGVEAAGCRKYNFEVAIITGFLFLKTGTEQEGYFFKKNLLCLSTHSPSVTTSMTGVEVPKVLEKTNKNNKNQTR